MKYQSSSTHCSSKVKIIEKWVKLQGQGQRVKKSVPTVRSYNRTYSYEISKLQHSLFKSYQQGFCFQEKDQTPRSMSQVLKKWYPRKGPITGNIYMKYQSFSNHRSKVIRKVKVFKKRVKLQGQCHRLKNNGTHGKVLSQKIFM